MPLKILGARLEDPAHPVVDEVDGIDRLQRRGTATVGTRPDGVSEKSRRRVQDADLAWADPVLVMERKYAARIEEALPWQRLPPMESLDVPDEFERMDQELVKVLRVAVDGAIERALR